MIHRFKMHGTNIVADVYSGAVHILDDMAFDLLEFYEEDGSFNEVKYKTSQIENISNQILLENNLAINKEIVNSITNESENLNNQIIEAKAELDELIKNGLLFSKDPYEGLDNLWKGKPVVKALCLHIAHDCNLRCKYCFAATGNFGGERTMMSAEIGKKAIDFLITNSESRKNLEIDFFGGEPLMNFDVVKEIVEYARSLEASANKNFRFTITTNALSLNDSHMEYINKNMHNVVLSLDGRPETNDKMRYRVDGSGSYEQILPKIKKMADTRNQNNYYVRGTFTRENLDFSKDVLHMADLGFKQISVEPVVAGKDSGYDLREQDLPTLYSEYETLVKEYYERRKGEEWFNFFHFMVDLSQGPCVAKRLGGCGSGHEYMAVTPEGDIYPCHQYVGMDEFKLGNVKNAEIKEEIRADFKSCNIYTKDACKKCWAKFYCSGGCSANAIQFNGSIYEPYEIGCELERKRVECALWLKAAEAQNL